jgi:hypothetical protein
VVVVVHCITVEITGHGLSSYVTLILLKRIVSTDCCKKVTQAYWIFLGGGIDHLPSSIAHSM